MVWGRREEIKVVRKVIFESGDLNSERQLYRSWKKKEIRQRNSQCKDPEVVPTSDRERSDLRLPRWYWRSAKEWECCCQLSAPAGPSEC